MVCDRRKNNKYVRFEVLILILLEYGLRQHTKATHLATRPRLNPYSIGIWSATAHLLICLFSSLNVLILILLEYGLRLCRSSRCGWLCAVLILILLEYGLRLLKSQAIDFQTLKIWKGLLLELISPKYVPFSHANIGILFIADCILAI